MPEAINLVPNIGVLLELIEDQAAAAPALLVRSIALLNLLPCHNSPTVRALARPQYSGHSMQHSMQHSKAHALHLHTSPHTLTHPHTPLLPQV